MARVLVIICKAPFSIQNVLIELSVLIRKRKRCLLVTLRWLNLRTQQLPGYELAHNKGLIFPQKKYEKHLCLQEPT